MRGKWGMESIIIKYRIERDFMNRKAFVLFIWLFFCICYHLLFTHMPEDEFQTNRLSDSSLITDRSISDQLWENPFASLLISHNKWPEQDLRLTWMMGESEHFRVLFPSHLEGFSERIIREAESLFLVLCEWTGFSPERTLDILITDNTDFANGFVTPGSRGFFITIHAVYPYQSSSTGIVAWKEWYRHLLLHELAHVFHLDIVSGGPALLRRIFGNVIYPNACAPPLYIEGFATYSETVLDAGYGRGSSPFTEMYIKTAYLEGRFPSLDRVANSTVLWPSEQAPYLFGVSFLDYLSSRYGEERLLEFNLRSGSFPMYTWGIPFKRVYGRRMGRLWKEWEKSVGQDLFEYENNQDTLFFKPVSSFAGYVYSLCIDHSGRKIAYSGRPVDGLGGLYIYDTVTKKERCVKKGLYAWGLSFSNDGKRLYYIRPDIYRNIYTRKNVYELELSRVSEKQLTRRGHAQSFLLIEAEEMLLVCEGTPTGTTLHIYDLIEGEVRSILLLVISVAPVLEAPSLSPDGDTLAFSYKNSHGHMGICLTSLEQLRAGAEYFQVLDGLFFNAYSPVWVGEGELLFVGDENGIYNLHTLDIRSGFTTRLSNVSNGVFDPKHSALKATLVLREYTSEGYRVVQAPLSDINSSLRAKSIACGVFPKRDLLSYEGEVSAWKVERYRPGRWLIPGYWLPFGIGPGGELGLGLSTGAQDPLKRHVYGLSLLYDLRDDSFLSLVDYTFNTALFSYFIRLSAEQERKAEAFDPAFAFYPGITHILRKMDYGLQTDLGFIFEDGHQGLNVTFTWDSLKGVSGWIGPERGGYFRHGTYYNLEQGDRFAVIDDYYAHFFKPFGVSLLSVRLQGKGGIDRQVVSGRLDGFMYLPLNGVYTYGFPDNIWGSYVLDVKTTIGFPLLRFERGIGAFPLFFRGMSTYLYNDCGFLFSEGEQGEFPLQPDATRASIGSELSFDFLLGYEFPLSLQIGYVYPLSVGGSEGFYASFRASIEF